MWLDELRGRRDGEAETILSVEVVLARPSQAIDDP